MWGAARDWISECVARGHHFPELATRASSGNNGSYTQKRSGLTAPPRFAALDRSAIVFPIIAAVARAVLVAARAVTAVSAAVTIAIVAISVSVIAVAATIIQERRRECESTIEVVVVSAMATMATIITAMFTAATAAAVMTAAAAALMKTMTAAAASAYECDAIVTSSR